MKIRTSCVLLMVLALPVYGDETPAAPVSAAENPNVVPLDTTVVDVALRNLKAAQAEFDAYVLAKRKEFSESGAYQSAKKAVDDAAAELETLQAPLREQIKAGNRLYARALEEIGPARAKLAEAVASKKPDDIAFRRSDVQYFEGVISQAERPVFSKDESVKRAEEKLEAANRKLGALQKKFNDGLHADPDFVALQKALNNAKSRLATVRSSGR